MTACTNNIHRKHEYDKHGTCATSIPALSTEFGFFCTVLSPLYEKYNFTAVLEKAGIVPGNSTYLVSSHGLRV